MLSTVEFQSNILGASVQCYTLENSLSPLSKEHPYPYVFVYFEAPLCWRASCNTTERLIMKAQLWAEAVGNELPHARKMPSQMPTDSPRSPPALGPV